MGRKRLKKLMVGLLVLLLGLVNIGSSRGKAVFSDIGGEWYETDVMELVEDKREIIKGFEDGSFRGEDPLSVAQFVSMIIRVGGYNLANGEDYWASPYIDKAIDLGLIGEKDFSDYDQVIARGDMAKIIEKYLSKIGKEEASDYLKMKDVILDYESFKGTDREEAILKVYRLGIITGYTDYSFKAKEGLKRGEASRVIVKIINKARRKPQDYERLKKDVMAYKEAKEKLSKLYPNTPKEVADHLIGGDKWVDPVKEAKKNFDEDLVVIKSDLENTAAAEKAWDYYENADFYKFGGIVDYDEKGVYPGHLEDIESVLRRRVPDGEAQKVMAYIRKKKDYKTYLPYRETYFHLDKGRYFVRLYEPIALGDEGYAGYVDVTIWYRDKDFIENREPLITGRLRSPQGMYSSHLYK